jgi:hypothetical protein
MLIATVPYVGQRLHLDPDPDPQLNYGSEHANNFWSGRIRIHNPDLKSVSVFVKFFGESLHRYKVHGIGIKSMARGILS